MKKKKVMVCVAAMTLSMVGCGSKAVTTESSVVSSEEAASVETESTVEPAQAEKEITVQDKVTFGKVTAVDGDTITVALGDMDIVEAPNGDKPEGEAPSGDKPEGEAPGGSEKGMPFKENGETVTITLDETVTIQVQDGKDITEGTSDDITEGNLISIIYDTDGNVTSIEVVRAGGETAPTASTEETSATEE